MQSAQVTVSMDRHDLAQSGFAAGLDGTVLISPYREGDYVAPGSRLLVVGSPGQLQVKAWVDESDSAGLVPGLRPGYTADLTITTAAATAAVVVPYDAIVGSGNQEKVFVVVNGLAVARNVRTGVSNLWPSSWGGRFSSASWVESWG